MSDRYQALASWYDRLQNDIDPQVWADYLVALDRRYRQEKALLQPGDGRDGRPILLDLGCGTGSICLAMETRGYDPIGVDGSAAMLQQAREKAADVNSHCLFLQQDLNRFELYGTVDLAVCLLDTLNHLIRPAQVRQFFNLCANYLNPGCLLIFDVATLRHFRQTLGDHLFFQDLPADPAKNQPALTLFWQNHYRQQTQISRSNLTLFIETEPDVFRRQDEQVVERCYDHAFLQACGRDAGLDYVARLGELSMAKPGAASERNFYVFRKPSKPSSKQEKEVHHD